MYIWWCISSYSSVLINKLKGEYMVYHQCLRALTVSSIATWFVFTNYFWKFAPIRGRQALICSGLTLNVIHQQLFSDDCLASFPGSNEVKCIWISKNLELYVVSTPFIIVCFTPWCCYRWFSIMHSYYTKISWSYIW